MSDEGTFMKNIVVKELSVIFLFQGHVTLLCFKK